MTDKIALDAFGISEFQFLSTPYLCEQFPSIKGNCSCAQCRIQPRNRIGAHPAAITNAATSGDSSHSSVRIKIPSYRPFPGAPTTTSHPDRNGQPARLILARHTISVSGFGSGLTCQQYANVGLRSGEHFLRRYQLEFAPLRYSWCNTLIAFRIIEFFRRALAIRELEIFIHPCLRRSWQFRGEFASRESIAW